MLYFKKNKHKKCFEFRNTISFWNLAREQIKSGHLCFRALQPQKYTYIFWWNCPLYTGENIYIFYPFSHATLTKCKRYVHAIRSHWNIKTYFQERGKIYLDNNLDEVDVDWTVTNEEWYVLIGSACSCLCYVFMLEWMNITYIFVAR